MVTLLGCIVVPALAMWAAARFKPAKTLGPVVLCYAAGIAAANTLHVEPSGARLAAMVAVPVAIPLMLFSTDLRAWLGLARGLLLSFVLACVAAVVAAGVVGFVFRAQHDEWWKIAGMLVGVYVGGTANMSAVGVALHTREETFVLLNASDVIAGGAYLLFLLSVAQRLLLKVLKPFAGTTEAAVHDLQERATNWRERGLSLGLGLAIVGASAGLSFLLFGELAEGFTLLCITSLGLVASLSARVRALEGSFDLGEYVLLVFCVAVGALADVSKLSGSSATLFAFVVVVMVSSAVLHFALCAAFGVDADTAIISSTATIFGPPFIGPVAAALKNRALVGPGLTLGLAGIALGTYLGLATSWVLHALVG